MKQPVKHTRFTFTAELLEEMAIESLGIDTTDLKATGNLEIEWDDAGSLILVVPNTQLAEAA